MAGFSDTAKDSTLTTLVGSYTWISLHTADPGNTGANEVPTGVYARIQTTWGTVGSPTQDAVTGSTVVVTVPASTTVTYWGLWTASTSGTWCTGGQLPAPFSTGGSSGTYSGTPTLNAAG